MENNINKTKAANKDNSIGYPLYPSNEDIYNKSHKEDQLNPEDTTKLKTPNQSQSGNDLDVPGAELDDEQEAIGNEDEENNYYSLGGDAHNNLEEDNT